MNKLKAFFQLIKFEHTLFALPFAYLGLFLAEGGFPRGSIFFWTSLTMVSIRTCGMALNRLADESIDARNPRTVGRKKLIELLTHPILWFATVFSAAIFLFSTHRLNTLCFALAPIPIFLVFVYPFLKRFTWLSHFWLGAILGLAPLGGWLASRGVWSWSPVLLTLAVMFWVSGFDMFYALQDMEFDRLEHLKSFPARFGAKATLLVTRFLHALTILMLAVSGFVFGLGIWYGIGVVLAAGFILKEHVLLARFGLQKINEAFFNLNAWVSVIIFLGVFLEAVFPLHQS